MLAHSDIKVGDKVYSPHHQKLFSVLYKDDNHLLVERIDGHPQDPRHIVSALQGYHWGLQSYEKYKEIARLTDQLNAMPQSHWR
jgi:hypothetical protein